MKAETTVRDRAHYEIYLGWLTVVLAASLPVYRPWVTLASILIIAFWLLSPGIGSRFARLRGHRLTYAVLAFLALNIASLAWSADVRGGVHYLMKYLYLLLIPVIASTVRPEFRRRAEAAFMISASIAVTLSIGIALNIWRIGDSFPENPSPAMSHLDFSVILALASLLMLNRAAYADMAGRTRGLHIAGFAFVAFGLAINIGRSGQLAFAVGLAALAAHWAKTRPIKKVAGVAAIFTLGLAIIWFATPRLRDRVFDARRDLYRAIVEQRYESNLGERVAAGIVAAEIARDHPILGTGVGANMAEFRRILDTSHRELKPAVYWYPHMHNQYLQIASELGIVGLVLVGWIFWELVHGPYPTRKLDGAAITITAVFLTAFLGDPFLHKQIPLIAFAVASGLVSGGRGVRSRAAAP